MKGKIESNSPRIGKLDKHLEPEGMLGRREQQPINKQCLSHPPTYLHTYLPTLVHPSTS